MRRITLPLLGALLLLGACNDAELPTALPPEAAMRGLVADICLVTTIADGSPAPESSLREALEDPNCSTIIFAEPGTITLTAGELQISRDVTIDGPGAAALAVSGNNSSRVFMITSGATVSISGLTISGGSSYEGGGIYNSGTLTLTHSTVSGNRADNRGGGGIFSATSSDWSTTSTTILNSTISGNTASTEGGGVMNYDGLTRIVHSTITDNRAPNGGGVFSWNDDQTRTDVKGSIIWGNTTDGTTANDVAAAETTTRYNSLGHNLIGAAGANVDFNQEFNQTGDETNVADAKLGPLALNTPGTTQTHALLAGSPAIDTGVCTDHNNATVSTDQRGVPRPQGSACDIGAFEVEQTAPSTPAQLLESLITLSASTPGVSRGTNNKLLEARTHLNAGRIGPACNKLREYITDVQNQRGKKISAADADLLIARAAEIRATLGC